MMISYSVHSKKDSFLTVLFFCKKIPLSRHVGYVMEGRISGSVRDVCMSHQSDLIYYKQPIKFLIIFKKGNLTLLFFTRE